MVTISKEGADEKWLLAICIVCDICNHLGLVRFSASNSVDNWRVRERLADFI